MAKRWTPNVNELRLLRRAAREGYDAYRYGSPKPITLPRIFTGQKRQNMVGKVIDIMRDWRYSPFEHEGATRAGVRTSLVLEGYGWQRADNEAMALIAEGHRLMGASRPTWIEGQWEYAIGRENCAQCRGPLDDAAIASRDRFCGEDCRRIMKTWQNANYHYAMTSRARWAYEVAQKAAIPERPCEWCGTMFRPSRHGAVTCSPEHAAKLREQKAGRLIPDRKCPSCGNIFHPQSRRVRFCSTACHNYHQMKTLPKRACALCNEEFQPTKTFMKYCSTKCGKKGYALEVAAALPEKPCAHCGEVFKPGKSTQDYCSRTCARRDRARKASAFTCQDVKKAA